MMTLTTRDYLRWRDQTEHERIFVRLGALVGIAFDIEARACHNIHEDTILEYKIKILGSDTRVYVSYPDIYSAQELALKMYSQVADRVVECLMEKDDLKITTLCVLRHHTVQISMWETFYPEVVEDFLNHFILIVDGGLFKPAEKWYMYKKVLTDHRRDLPALLHLDIAD